jgi:hypothetical protein
MAKMPIDTLDVAKQIIRNVDWERVTFITTGAELGVLELCRIGHLRGETCPDICSIALANGHSHIIEWALEHGYTLPREL